MAFALEVAKTTFAAGEVSPALRVRSDLAKQQTGLWYLENMVVLVEGGVKRRSGTQMVLTLDAAHAYVGIPFRFSGSASNAYLIVIGGGVAQFILGNGVVQAPAGGPYQVAVPYQDADLGGAGAATAGVSNLRWCASGNVVFLFCDGYAPQMLTRNADNSWTLAPYLTPPSPPVPQGGCIAPVDTENLDPTQTLAISDVVGAITLYGSPNFAGAAATVPGGFNAAHVGSIWRLDESNLSLTPEWTADEEITVAVATIEPASYVGTMANPANAFDGNLATAATQTGAAGYIGGEFATAAALITATATCGSAAAEIFRGSTGSGTVSWYAANAAPANSTAGVLLASGTVALGGSSITLQSNDQITEYQWSWLTWSTAAGTEVYFAEIDFQGLAATGAPTLRRYNGNVYQALNEGSAGANPPVHTSGIVLSGTGGIQWLYRHRDRGFVQITAVASPTQASATVLEQIPDSVSAQATANWWPSAWDGLKGWPDRAAIVNDALLVARQQKFWETQPGTFNNWDIVDPTSAQSAIEAALISPNGSLAWIEAFLPGVFLGALTRDEEWAMVGQNPFAAISIENLAPYPTGKNGSAQHVPAAVDGGFVTISRSRARAHFAELQFNGVMPTVAVDELTISARHILGQLGGGALGVSYQQDPGHINWFWCANGLLVGNSLMRAQQINGWHRHPQHAPTRSQVLSVATIPSSDEGVSWTYLFTQRTLDGAPAKFVELLQPFFTPANFFRPTAAGAWMLDCALQYTGAPVTVVGGLNHLANTEVGVHADGCEYRMPNGQRPTVAADGTLTLSRTTQNCVVGLPIKYRARLLPLDLSIMGSSTAGERQKANHLFLRVVDAAGGNVVVNPDEGGLPEALEEPRTLTYGAPVPLRTGIIRTPGLDVPLADQCIVEIFGDDTMPFELSAVDPDIVIAENSR